MGIKWASPWPRRGWGTHRLAILALVSREAIEAFEHSADPTFSLRLLEVTCAFTAADEICIVHG